MIESIKYLVRSKMAEASDCGVRQFIDCVRPIFGVTNQGRPNHIGTALLLCWKGRYYVVTAAHVIDENSRSTLYLGADGDLHEINADFWCTEKPNGDRTKDYYDFAWARIEKIHEAAPDVWNFIPESSIGCDRVYGGKHLYLALGYPNSKNKKHDHVNRTLTPRYFRYSGTLDLTHTWENQRSLPIGAHFCLKYDNKHAKDSDGNKVNAICPTGMSGGALIDMGALNKPAAYMKGHDPRGVLVGMLIEQSKSNNLLVAVSIQVILEKIDAREL